MKNRTVGTGVALLLLATQAPAVADTTPQDADDATHVRTSTQRLTPLTFDALLVSEHPLIDAMIGAQTGYERSRRAMGPLDANPVVTVTPGARVVGIKAPGPEWAVAISQDFAVGGQLQARADALAIEGRQLLVAVEVERFERRLGAALLWLDSWRLQATLGVLSDELGLCETALDAARRAAARGALTRLDMLVLESWRSDIALKRLSVEGQLFEVAGALGRALGADATTRGPQDIAGGPMLPVATGRLPSPPEPSQDALETLISGLPAQRLADLTTLLESARVRELQASRDLRLHVSLQADADAERNTGVRIGIGVPLSVVDTQDRELPAQLARRGHQEALAAETKRQLGYRVFMLQHELQHSREVLAEIDTSTLPAIDRVVEVQTARLAAGEITVFELVDTRRRRLETLARRQDAEVALTRARLEAWLLWQAAAPNPSP